MGEKVGPVPWDMCGKGLTEVRKFGILRKLMCHADRFQLIWSITFEFVG